MESLFCVVFIAELRILGVYCISPEIKGLIKNKMKEINELKQMGENQGETQKRALKRAEEILQKYKKIATISQNVLRVCLFCNPTLFYSHINPPIMLEKKKVSSIMLWVKTTSTV